MVTKLGLPLTRRLTLRGCSATRRTIRSGLPWPSLWATEAVVATARRARTAAASGLQRATLHLVGDLAQRREREVGREAIERGLEGAPLLDERRAQIGLARHQRRRHAVLVGADEIDA